MTTAARTLPALARGGTLVTAGALVALAAVAWVVTDGRMDGMDMGPGTDPGSLGFYVSTWVVMMAAMMFPSAAPMVAIFRRLQQGRRETGMPSSPLATPLFVAGYLVTWTAAGLVAYGLLEAGRALAPDALSWDRAGRWIAGGVLAVAAAYQLTPLKDACLTRCRGPLSFLLERWRDGPAGALRMGIEHGAWCVGCCWALMAALFALGAMSIGWMALVAAFIAVEKLLPWPRAANVAVAGLLLALAVGVAVDPGSVPGLTVPEGPMAPMAPMGGMGEM